ncbi:MAG: hypothetical protein AB8C84_01660 [Oligoflexales bacterium]
MSFFSGLMEWYRKGQTERLQRAVVKSAKVVRNSKANRDDRKDALAFFVQLEDVALAAPVLLDRFEYSLEHGINDTREKESAMEGLVKYKDAVLPYVEKKLLATEKIAWPIKVLMELTDEEKRVEILQNCLSLDDVALEQAKVDKNYDVLCYLADYTCVDLKKIVPFLKDPDERVRFAAAAVVIDNSGASGPEFLENFLVDESSENRRIHRLVVEAFVDKGWPVKELEPGPLTAGLVVTQDKLVRQASHSV